MNKQIRRLAIGMVVLYLALFVQLNLIQVVRADDYNASPLNNRPVVADFAKPRGLITSSDGVVLAQSIPSDDKYEWQRQYPQGELFSSITGYFSFTLGSDGVEKSYNDVLAGRTGQQRLRGLLHLFQDRSTAGDVTTTVRADVQQAAAEALGDRDGSVVALDPRTGAILALWSKPSYDPNVLASHDFAAAEAAAKALQEAPGNPLRPASYRERYFPGSTFKVVTAAAGLESGQVTATTPEYPVRTSYTPPGSTRPINNFGGQACGGNMVESLVVSCNSSFAQMGVDLGAGRMVSTADAFGFREAPPLDLPRPAASFFPSVEFFDDNEPLLALSAIGQGDVQGSPLEMALVAAGVANSGVIMAPHVMQDTRDADGKILARYQPRQWKQPMSAQNAAVLRDAMVQVVQRGTAQRLQIPGVPVAAKTGTAQLGTEVPSSHAWVIAFAPADAPRVAVAVLVKAQPGVSEITGGAVAAPIARQVIEQVLAAPDPLQPAGG